MEIRLPFRKQQFEAREDAILDAVNRLLSRKGFDLMTMDDVADEVGVAKGSLYKHFPSKERLAAAAMSRLLRETVQVLDAMPPEWTAGERLRAILRWSIERRLQGGVPHLPSTRGAFQRSLMLNLDYLGLAVKANRRFYALVAEAKKQGELNAELSDDVVVYSIYARSCDPTVDFLKQDGKLKDAEIVDAIVSATFQGLSARPQAVFLSDQGGKHD